MKNDGRGRRKIDEGRERNKNKQNRNCTFNRLIITFTFGILSKIKVLGTGWFWLA